QIRGSVGPQQPNEDLRDDPSTDRSQALPTAHQIGFLEDVVPEGRGLIELQAAVPAQLDEVGRREPLGADRLCDGLARGEAPREVAQQVALRQRGGRLLETGDGARDEIQGCEVVSNVKSWSTNWPRNVMPAVCVVLFGLFWLRLRSVMSSAAPLERSSLASRMPPGLPMSMSAACRAGLLAANGGSCGNMRPNRPAG